MYGGIFISKMGNKFLFCNILLVFLGGGILGEMEMAQQNSTRAAAVEVNVGVVLDLNSAVGKMGLSCIQMALSDFYAPNSIGSSFKTRLVLHVRDSKGDNVLAAASALDLLKNVKVQAIIGPSTSTEADFVSDLGDKVQVPVISFSATSPSVSPTRNPFFIRATQNDSSQVQAISTVIKTFGWREAVPIYIDSEYGSGLIPFLTDALQEVGARVPYRSVISPSATDDQIVEELHKLTTMQTRVFIVHMPATLGNRFFSKAKEVGMMSEGYVWIITYGLANVLASMDTSVVQSSMQGVLGARAYIPRTQKLDNFNIRFRIKSLKGNPEDSNGAEANIYGLWAYDTFVALAEAVEKVGATKDGNFKKSNITLGSFTLRISQTGRKLRQEISRKSFNGLSGDFSLVDGQLHSPIFQIVNVNGSRAREIGFWTQEHGLTGELGSIDSNNRASMVSNLGPIIWPGKAMTPPKGWVIPTSGKRLKIGVPMKGGFEEFVKVTIGANNIPIVTGYCIDIFRAVMGSLKYSVPYDFVPFEVKGDTNYDQLVHLVHTKMFDAVVGDVTILADRTQYVDFTLPYTESGVSMVVPLIENKRSKNAWAFLKPLTWKLWVTSLFFFILIGIVVWVMERRNNNDFRGQPWHQVGTILWFSFSTMVFAHKEKVSSSLGRFVVIVWVFVMLILTQSYTASLTALLTVKQLQPTVTNPNELIKSGEFVGYQRGSFVQELLKKMNIPESKLRNYSTVVEMHEALTNGSARGGVAAVFDEIPYMKLLLAKHCRKYTMVQPTYKTNGLGFAFPIGSLLVSNVSKAVLKVIEGDIVTQMEAKYFGQASCPDSASTSTSSSGSLGLDSFWGLFLIVGIACSTALLLHFSIFLCENRNVLSNPDYTLLGKFRELARRYVGEDSTSHTSTGKDALADPNYALLSRKLRKLLQLVEEMDRKKSAGASSVSPASALNIKEDQPDGNSNQCGEQGIDATHRTSGEISREVPRQQPALELKDESNEEEAGRGCSTIADD